MDYWSNFNLKSTGASHEKNRQKFELFEKKLRELEELHNRFESYMEIITGVKGAGKPTRNAEDGPVSLLYGQHRIYSQVGDGAAAQAALELARAVARRIMHIRQEVVEMMLPKIKRIAMQFLKKYFPHLTNHEREDTLLELITEGCSGILKKIGQVRIGGEYNVYESFNYLCRAAMMGMKKYVETELRYARAHVQPTALFTSRRQNGSNEGVEEEIDIFDRVTGGMGRNGE